MSDEVPAWWPPVWHDDGDDDLGWWPFGENPAGHRYTRRYPFVRQWRKGGGPCGELFVAYTGTNEDDVLRNDCLLEVLCFLIALDRENNKVITGE